MITKCTVLDTFDKPVDIDFANCYAFGAKLYFTNIKCDLNTSSSEFKIMFEDNETSNNFLLLLKELHMEYSCSHLLYEMHIDGKILADIISYSRSMELNKNRVSISNIAKRITHLEIGDR